MAHSLLWKDVNLSTTEELVDAHGKDGFKDVVLRVLNKEEDTKTPILVSVYHHLIGFCVTENMSSEKISVLFSLVKSTHERAMGEFLPLETAFAHFRDLLLAHSVQRPPFSVGIFDLADVKLIVDYILDNYFRHYRLYKYVFTRRNLVNVETLGKVHEEPTSFRPLAEAMTEEEWNEKVRKEQEEKEAAQHAKLEEEVAARKAAREEEGIELPPSVEEIVEKTLQVEIEKLRSEFSSSSLSQGGEAAKVEGEAAA
eukprot:CAMPEP_0113875220 /NCGR_PEP_ID=MMETSP0780_2-20120614/4815_1 /TAXON_ID=652834 /ORGANISM="Palpitomonas bilix" /LENGTH=254 /DNA_ID=CAMNT_0000861173 /DNA_START=203 /DNA_END=967 /DNA_ORIENTATION=- /assembly_acc=CAM_ASM_000599